MRTKLSILAAFGYMIFQVVYALVSMDDYSYLYMSWWIINGTYIPYILLKKYKTIIEHKLTCIVSIFIIVSSLFGAIDSIFNLSDTLYSILIGLYMVASILKLTYDRRAVKQEQVE